MAHEHEHAPNDDAPHDILAAEEFVVPAPDPALHEQSANEESPHDVLAAEEFVVPAPDPVLHHEPLTLPPDPDDPAGVEPPHDVLAAEEFAVPAPPQGAPSEPADSSRTRWPLRVAVAAAVVLACGAAVKLRRRG